MLAPKSSGRTIDDPVGHPSAVESTEDTPVNTALQQLLQRVRLPFQILMMITSIVVTEFLAREAAQEQGRQLMNKGGNPGGAAVQTTIICSFHRFNLLIPLPGLSPKKPLGQLLFDGACGSI